MSNSLADIMWPALRLGSPHCALLRYDTKDRFCTVTFTSIKVLTNLQEHFLIDSLGKKFTLGAPQLQERLSPVGCAFARITNKWVRVMYPNCRYAGDLSVTEVSALVFRNWAEDPDFWADYPLDEMRRRLKAAKNVGELIQVF